MIVYKLEDYIKDDAELQKAVIREFLIEIKRLEEENEKLKEEIKIQDNLAEHFRKEALYWAKIAEDYIKVALND